VGLFIGFSSGKTLGWYVIECHNCRLFLGCCRCLDCEHILCCEVGSFENNIDDENTQESVGLNGTMTAWRQPTG
jgi:hypothetical protein